MNSRYQFYTNNQNELTQFLSQQWIVGRSCTDEIIKSKKKTGQHEYCYQKLWCELS